MEVLATGAGDVRSRLWDAYLCFHPVRADDVPADLRGDFEWVKKMLTRREPRHPGEGSVKASLATMQNRTGVRIAKMIVYLEARLSSLLRSS